MQYYVGALEGEVLTPIGALLTPHSGAHLTGQLSNPRQAFQLLAAQVAVPLDHEQHHNPPALVRVVKTPQRQRRLAAVQVDDLVDAYQAGTKVTELARRYGISRRSAYNHLERAGVDLRPQGLPAHQLAEATRLYAQGWTLAQLGERYGVSGGRVGRALRQLGVAIRPSNWGWGSHRN